MFTYSGYCSPHFPAILRKFKQDPNSNNTVSNSTTHIDTVNMRWRLTDFPATARFFQKMKTLRNLLRCYLLYEKRIGRVRPDNCVKLEVAITQQTRAM